MNKTLLFAILLFAALANDISAVEETSVLFTPKNLKETENGWLLLRFDFCVFGPVVKYAVIQGMNRRDSDEVQVGSSDFYKIEVFTGKKWGEGRMPEWLCGTGRGSFYFMPHAGDKLEFVVGQRKDFEALREKSGKNEMIVFVRVKMPIELIEYDAGKIKTDELQSGFVVLRLTPSAMDVLRYCENSNLTDAEYGQLMKELEESGSNKPLVTIPTAVTPSAAQPGRQP